MPDTGWRLELIESGADIRNALAKAKPEPVDNRDLEALARVAEIDEERKTARSKVLKANLDQERADLEARLGGNTEPAELTKVQTAQAKEAIKAAQDLVDHVDPQEDREVQLILSGHVAHEQPKASADRATWDVYNPRDPERSVAVTFVVQPTDDEISKRAQARAKALETEGGSA